MPVGVDHVTTSPTKTSTRGPKRGAPRENRSDADIGRCLTDCGLRPEARVILDRISGARRRNARPATLVIVYDRPTDGGSFDVQIVFVQLIVNGRPLLRLR